MPKSRRRQNAPEGWDIYEPELRAIADEMREAELSDTHGKRKDELLWPIFKAHYKRSRYVYEEYYVNETMTKECYDYAVKQGHADPALIAKWRKAGYERLCCLRCIQPKDSQFGSTCICRVPRKELDEVDGKPRLIQCVHCGCRGCASSDSPIETTESQSASTSSEHPE